MLEIIIPALIAAAVSLITLFANRKWKVKDTEDADKAEILDKLENLTNRLNQHIVKDDRRAADAHRARILQFNNDIMRGGLHTHEEFIDILMDIDAYEKHCEEDKGYKNNRAVYAIGNIKNVYKNRLSKNDFLSEIDNS